MRRARHAEAGGQPFTTPRGSEAGDAPDRGSLVGVRSAGRAGRGSAGLIAAELVDDAKLADAMIARAFETDAAVVVFSPHSARLLGDDPVAAVPRY